MSASDLRHLGIDPRRRPLNKPTYEVTYVVSLLGVPGSVYLGEDDLARYVADPDLFAAKYLGITVELYYEWLECEGVALCGERTKSGRPCRNVVKCCDNAMEWQEWHRSVACVAHGGESRKERARAANGGGR